MQRGVSPTVSFVLIVAIIVIASSAAYLWAYPLVNGINEPGKVKNLQNQMISLDYMIRATAHGDINFTNSYELYAPSGYLWLNDTHDKIRLTFLQKAEVIGQMQTTANTDCGYLDDNIHDTDTNIMLAREMNLSRVYWGSKGIGETEIMICYNDIDLEFGGICSKGKTGSPRLLVYMKKFGIDSTTGKPKVYINIC